MAHKTIRSVNRALKYAEQRGLKTELLLVLDRANPETKQYVETSGIIDPAARIIATDFGDVGPARNAGIEKARGEYVATFDGDDLMMENWLVRAHEFNRLNPSYVIHPELAVCFGKETALVHYPDQEQEDFDGTSIFFQASWPVVSFSRRETYLSVPYCSLPPHSGYGAEDWHWNCEVMGRGWVHKIAPGAAFFYRRKKFGSLAEEHRLKNLMGRHSILFDHQGLRFIKGPRGVIQEPALTGPREAIPKGKSFCQRALTEKNLDRVISRLPVNIRRLLYFARRPPGWNEKRYLELHADIKAAVEQGEFSCGFEHWERHGRQEGRRVDGITIPEWLRDEMLALGEIEPQLFPSQAFLDSAVEHRAMQADKGEGLWYFRFLEERGDRSFTHAFLLSGLGTGGEEVMALNQINNLAGEEGAQILVILTEEAGSPQPPRLHDSVTLLRYGPVRSRVHPYYAEKMLARFLLKYQPAVVHNINSDIAWELFSKYGAPLSSVSMLYASLFPADLGPNGELRGWAQKLEKAHYYLQGVFTDNPDIAAKLRELYGFRNSLFSGGRHPGDAGPRFVYHHGE
jgi:glycosyltransferase involved in cell wall biosynthesis